MSEAIRMFLQEVVRCGGLPFPVRDPLVQVVSEKYLWSVKRAEQARQRELIERGELPPEATVMLTEERLRGSRVEWPDDSLRDD